MECKLLHCEYKASRGVDYQSIPIQCIVFSGLICSQHAIEMDLVSQKAPKNLDSNDSSPHIHIIKNKKVIQVFYTELNLNRLVPSMETSATLTSPEGSTSIILLNRPYDIVTEGYYNWPLLSVLHWGEDPRGQWTLQVNWKNSAGYANVSGVSVTLYGTATIPQSVASIPDECSPSCARSKGCAAAGAEFCDIDACNSTLLCDARVYIT